MQTSHRGQWYFVVVLISDVVDYLLLSGSTDEYLRSYTIT